MQSDRLGAGRCVGAFRPQRRSFPALHSHCHATSVTVRGVPGNLTPNEKPIEAKGAPRTIAHERRRYLCQNPSYSPLFWLPPSPPAPKKRPRLSIPIRSQPSLSFQARSVSNAHQGGSGGPAPIGAVFERTGGGTC